MAAVTASRTALPPSQSDHSACHAREKALVRQVTMLKKVKEQAIETVDYFSRRVAKLTSEGELLRQEKRELEQQRQHITDKMAHGSLAFNKALRAQQKESMEREDALLQQVVKLKADKESWKQESELWMSKTQEVVAIADTLRRQAEAQKKEIEALQDALKKLNASHLSSSTQA